MTPEEDKKLISILSKRSGSLTTVELQDSTQLSVWNITYGYDMGVQFAHVTTNISPGKDGFQTDFFVTSDVAKVIDSDTKVELISFPVSGAGRGPDR